MIRIFSRLANNFKGMIEDLNDGIHGTIIHYDCKKSYMKKNHFCFECERCLEVKKREVIVNSESEEAKKYDFYMLDGYAMGNIRFITFYFMCPKCGKVYEVRDYIKLEEIRKREHRKEKWKKLLGKK